MPSEPQIPKGWRLRKWKMTHEGKVFVAMAALVGLAAVNTGNNLVYLVFGFMLTLMLVSGVLSELVLKDIHADRILPKHLYAETPFLVQVILRNKKKHLYSYSIEAEEFGGRTQVYFPKLPPQNEELGGYQLTLPRRGTWRFEGFWLKSRFPFGLIEKAKFVRSHTKCLVYPKPIAPLAFIETQQQPEEENWQLKKGRGGEFYGLRQYVPGDEAKRIHWRRSAALGYLVVKERGEAQQNHLHFFLDPLLPEHNQEDWHVLFEKRISEAAGLVVHGIQRGRTVELVVRDQDRILVRPQQGAENALRFLAELQAKPKESLQPPGTRMG